MSTKEYTRWSNRVCKRGARIGTHYSEFYIVQQSEPYDTQISEICCQECEAERDD